VRKDIYDPYFPTQNNGYAVYSIEEGSHHFNGKEALDYARTRKTTSDFDRSERQQQILQAIRVKLKRFNILEDLEKSIELFETAINGIKTDIDVFEALYYFKLYQNYPIESNNVLSNNNLLYSTRSFDGQYILLPKTGGFDEIKAQISALINN
jgi:anionic cell wall polymer biosynthesis LytR-Cps2A-Psr (LCP) family protein